MVEFKVVCSKHWRGELSAHLEDVRGTIRLEVEPCEECLDEARLEGARLEGGTENG